MTIFEEKDVFELRFDVSWFRKGDTLVTGESSIELTVIEEPRRKWYHILFQIITFGWYRASWSYKVTVKKI